MANGPAPQNRGHQRTIETTSKFDKMKSRLPPDKQATTDRWLELLRSNATFVPQGHPIHPNKRGSHKKDSRSCDIGTWRAIYVTDGPIWRFYWIGSHADYDAFIGKKSRGHRGP